MTSISIEDVKFLTERGVEWVAKKKWFVDKQIVETNSSEPLPTEEIKEKSVGKKEAVKKEGKVVLPTLNIEDFKEDDPLGIGSVKDTRKRSFVNKAKNITPVFVRQFVYDTARGSGDITENDLNDGEYSAIVRGAKNALDNGRKVLTYDDFRAVGAPGEDVRTSSVDFLNPAQSVQLLLGKASIEIDDEGEVYIIDSYDYNDAGDKENRYSNKYTNEKGLLKIDEATSFSNIIYRAARNFKTITARDIGEGSRVRIHIGNIKDYGVKI